MIGAVPPHYTTVIVQFFKEILDPLLHVYVHDAYQQLAAHLKVPLGIAVTLYIAIMGLSIAMGWIQASMGNLVKSAIKLGLIYMFAMNWDYFSHWIVMGIENSAEQIGGWLIDATPTGFHFITGGNVEGALQSLLIQITKVGEWIWKSGSWHHFSPFVTAGLIWLFGYAVILVGFFEIVVAKIMLAILFATAPLFIAFTLFKPTHGFFDRWLGMIVGYALLLIFVSAVLALSMTFLEWTLAGMLVGHAVHVTFVGFVPTMIIGALCVGILLAVSSMAQSIGGAVSTSSGSALLAGVVGGAIGGSMTAMSMGGRATGAGQSLGGAGVGVLGGIKRAGESIGSSLLNGVRGQIRGGK